MFSNALKRDVIYTIASFWGAEAWEKQGKESKLTTCLNFSTITTFTLSCLITSSFIWILSYLQILNWVQLQSQN